VIGDTGEVSKEGRFPKERATERATTVHATTIPSRRPGARSQRCYAPGFSGTHPEAESVASTCNAGDQT